MSSPSLLWLDIERIKSNIENRPLAELERIAILATLESAGGNKTEAARRLGITARTISNKLKLWEASDE